MTRSLARLTCGVALAMLAASAAQADPAALSSPDGRLSIRVETVDGAPALSVSRDGRMLIAPSAVGLALSDGSRPGAAGTRFTAAPAAQRKTPALRPAFSVTCPVGGAVSA